MKSKRQPLTPASHRLARIKRGWIPEWLFARFKPVIPRWPFRQIFTRELSEFEERRFNGGAR